MQDETDRRSTTETSEPAPDETPRRVAVVFIHGQGQQQPMEDVEKLAQTVWQGDHRIDPNGEDRPPGLWTVPDPGSHRATADNSTLADSGRVTTNSADNIRDADGHPLRVDFIEFYWAHLMEGNRLGHLMTWFIALQQRPRGRVPRRLLAARQWILRPTESLILVALLFSLLTAILLPQDQMTSINTSLVWKHIPFFFKPIGGASMVSFLAMLAILAGAASMVWNELRGGRPDPDKQADKLKRRHQTEPERALDQQKRASGKALNSFYVAIFGAVFCIPLILILIAGRGPTADWSDMTFMINLLTLCGGVIFAARKVIKALWVAMGAAALSGAASLQYRQPASDAALFPEHVRLYVESFGPSGQDGGVFQSVLTAVVDGLGVFMATPEAFCIRQTADMCMNTQATGVQVILPFMLLMLTCFAVWWSLLGLNSVVAAPKTPWLRTLWTLIILLASAMTAAMFWFLISQTLFTALHSSLGVILGLLLIFGGLVFVVARDKFLVPVMADSARYFSKDPDNVAARNRVRAAGVKLLKRLHHADYDRIVIVAHSLGTVIGYELLADYWSRATLGVSFSEEDDVCAKVKAVEIAAQDVETAAKASLARESGAQQRIRTARAVYRTCQRELSQSLSRKSAHDNLGSPWKISDFITLGSPLTHASLLMAESTEDMNNSFDTRRHSACPPRGMNEGDISPIRFVAGELMNTTVYRFTHSAVFSAVRWSNLYFDQGKVFAAGDVIGGPLNYVEAVDGDQVGFGEGIEDMALDYRETGTLFAHNEYWKCNIDVETLRTLLKGGKPIYIAALISSLNLREGLPQGPVVSSPSETGSDRLQAPPPLESGEPRSLPSE